MTRGRPVDEHPAPHGHSDLHLSEHGRIEVGPCRVSQVR